MMTTRRTFLLGTTAAVSLLAGCAGAPRQSAPTRTPAVTDNRSGPGPASGSGSGSGAMGRGSGSDSGSGQMGPHSSGSGSMGPGSPGTGPHGPGSGAGGTPIQSTNPELTEWFADVPNYVGVMDWTGYDEVRVRVGVGDGFRFGPAAIRVSPGTRVVWEWTGQGGSHNVVADGGDFESQYFAEAGATFAHVFEKPGTARYYCAPHLALGMKGAVVVSDVADE